MVYLCAMGNGPCTAKLLGLPVGHPGVLPSTGVLLCQIPLAIHQALVQDSSI